LFFFSLDEKYIKFEIAIYIMDKAIIGSTILESKEINHNQDNIIVIE
jgi:hypothetical protein